MAEYPSPPVHAARTTVAQPSSLTAVRLPLLERTAVIKVLIPLSLPLTLSLSLSIPLSLLKSLYQSVCLSVFLSVCK